MDICRRLLSGFRSAYQYANDIISANGYMSLITEWFRPAYQYANDRVNGQNTSCDLYGVAPVSDTSILSLSTVAPD